MWRACGVAGGLSQGPFVFYSLAFEVNSFFSCFSFVPVFSAAMVHPTNNSMHTAPIHQPVLPDEEDPHRSDVPSASGDVSAYLPANPPAPVPANVGISPEMAVFIAQMVKQQWLLNGKG